MKTEINFVKGVSIADHCVFAQNVANGQLVGDRLQNFWKTWSLLGENGGHGGRVVTLSPPTSAAGVRSPSWP